LHFSEEYDFTRHYIAFEQLRYEDRLKVDLQIDPETFHFDLPPFSMQPWPKMPSATPSPSARKAAPSGLPAPAGMARSTSRFAMTDPDFPLKRAHRTNSDCVPCANVCEPPTALPLTSGRRIHAPPDGGRARLFCSRATRVTPRSSDRSAA
jgi:hypothetical protein